MTRRNKKPRPLSDVERNKLDEFIDSIHYSGRYVGSSHVLSEQDTAALMAIWDLT